MITLAIFFGTLDAGAFRRCFVAWVAAPTKTPSEVIAIDGKTLRRSYQKKDSKAPIHMVSAFAARQRLVLGQVKVNEKSNEIVAISALLEMMAIEGAVITLDAMGCQRGIAKKIMDRKRTTSSRSRVIRERCWRMSRSSQSSRKQEVSRTRRSVCMRPQTAIMAASKPLN